MARRWMILAIALVGTGCHRDAGEPVPGGSPDGAAAPGKKRDGAVADPGVVSAACDELARVRCDRKVRCDPKGFRYYHLDMDECLSQEAEQCRFEMTLPDASRDQAWLLACIEATQVPDTCGEAYFQFADTPGCGNQPGKRKVDDTCQDELQCESLRCDVTSSTARCGHCIATVGIGELCSSSTNCKYPLGCRSGRCTERAKAGEPCEDIFACGGATWCVDGVCKATVADGEPCQHLTDCRNRLSDCVAGVCQGPDIRGEGESCRGSLGGPSVMCAFGLDCPVETCIAGPKRGETCSDPSACSGRDWCYTGICEPPDAAWCPITGEVPRP